MLMLRLQRVGKKKQPSYRLIVSEKAKDPQAGYTEALGNYNPLANPKVVAFKKERILYWMSKGAQPSPTVHNLLLKEGIITTGKKKKSVFISKRRKETMEKEKIEKK